MAVNTSLDQPIIPGGIFGYLKEITLGAIEKTASAAVGLVSGVTESVVAGVGDLKDVGLGSFMRSSAPGAQQETGLKLGGNAHLHNHGVQEDLSKPNSVSMTEIGNVMQSTSPTAVDFGKMLDTAGFGR